MKILTCIEPVQFAYGTAEIPELKPGNANIKIKRIGICGTDLPAFKGTQLFFNYPRILGRCYQSNGGSVMLLLSA